MSIIASSQLATISVIAMNRYGTLFLFIIGILGNLLNVYVFSRARLLRQNNCVLFLLISSLLNLITLFFWCFYSLFNWL